MSGFEIVRSNRARRATEDATRENTGRLATFMEEFVSTGFGEFVVPDRVEFELAFTERPAVSYGYSMDGALLVPTRFPHCGGGVYEWDVSPSGLYLGAWLIVTVDTKSPQLYTDVVEDPGYTIVHDFTFTGYAIKNIPAHLLNR